MPIDDLITAFVTLFVVIDPIGLAPMFVAITAGMTPRQRRIIGLRACLTAVGLLTIFGLFGDAVLDFIGISMPAFRIAGGILLFLTALDMLFERRSKRRDTLRYFGDYWIRRFGVVRRECACIRAASVLCF